MSSFKDLINSIIFAIDEGKVGTVATVIKAKGSTPAPSGSKMFICEDGSFIGSVGGGCMESEIWMRSKYVMMSKEPQKVTFHLTSETVEDEGMVCGGKVEIFVEPLKYEHKPIYKKALECFVNGDSAILLTTISRPYKKVLLTEGGHVIGDKMENLEYITSEFFSLKDPQIFRGVVVEPLICYEELIIYGAGHISQHACRFAKAVGFYVTIVDDRENFANKERFPEADRILIEKLTSLSLEARPPKKGYAVIATRGHKNDAFVLEQILNDPPKYVGMIGSQRKVKTVYNYLESKGIGKDSLKRVHAPIGLRIGAKTPEEIGLSIVAELVKERRKR
ncbi:MAG: XdhC family protein [Deltaproteobacteria bacterium]|nr:XdhC family protein [Deltaproteobacteria bacterium]